VKARCGVGTEIAQHEAALADFKSAEETMRVSSPGGAPEELARSEAEEELSSQMEAIA
jgi:hypothetical protein